MSTVDAVDAEALGRGLTAAEAEERRRRGEANTAVSGVTRSFASILRTNVLSFFNIILFVIGVALLALGRSSDALISVGLGLVNAVISATQEIRAKRKLDRVQLLDRAPVRVIRDGSQVELAPDAVVRGDVLAVRPSEQVVVDGPLLSGGPAETDESLLTGQPEPVVILAVTMLGLGFPYSPTQVGLTLLTVGIPTLFLTFWAQPTRPDPHLLANLARFTVPAALVTGGFATAVYAFLHESVTRFIGSGRTPAQVISDFEGYTGLAYTDADFTEAAATIGAQTGLSTFICLASFVLILFLAPPHRLFAAWTRPVADRRPTVLVALLLAAFAAILFVPTLYNYFGLTAGNSFVSGLVAGAVVLSFVALSAAYRVRLLDRILGVDQIKDHAD